MERHAFDAESIAALLEFRGTITRTHASQIWKQWTAGRQTPQHRRDALAEVDHG
jgi:hypothetical protein